jgi:hypothetical protein
VTAPEHTVISMSKGIVLKSDVAGSFLDGDSTRHACRGLLAVALQCKVTALTSVFDKVDLPSTLPK